MRAYSILHVAFIALFFAGCNDESVQSEQNRCPKCNMSVKESDDYSAKLHDGSKVYFFDDLGCLVLWTKEKHRDVDQDDIEVFAKDTKRYIKAKEAYFSISDKTPMSYGFGAYENDKNDTIEADEVILRMLRGEHMANPKIRKQILGE